MNLTASPSPTAPLTRSVIVFSSKSSESNSLTNDQDLGVAKERLGDLGSKSYRSFLLKVRYPTTSLFTLLATDHSNQSSNSGFISKWINLFANGAGILYTTP